MTLKPSKKTKQKKQNNKKQPKKTHQKKQNNNIKPQNQEQSKQNRNKSKRKKKQTQETQKHLNLPNPDEQQWATPEKNQKTGKKTSIFNTFETIPDTPKTNL